MSFETAKDVLDHAKDYHRQLAGFYQELKEKSDNERVKMLLDYLISHEKKHETGLSDYESRISSKKLKTWFQYPPSKDNLATCLSLSADNYHDLSLDGVVETAMNLDNCLIQVYDSMISSSDTAEMKDIFRNLKEMEVHEEHELAWNSAQLKDL